MAVDETPREIQDEVARTVKQPLPLPQGVSNNAISGGGSKVQTTPEPGAPLMILIGLLTLLFARQRNRGFRGRA